MTWWKRLWHRWRLERDLDVELRYHLDRLTNDLTAAGLSPAEARRRAAAEFGSLEELKDACREVRGTRLAHDLAFDLRTGARLLLKDRAVTVLAVVVLAIGVGLSTTLFTIVDALCLRAFPLDGVERLVEIGELLPSGARRGLTRDQWDRLATGGARAVVQVAAYTTRPAVLREGSNPAERITAAYASGSLFEALRLRAAAGRGLGATDDAAGAAPAVVLAERRARAFHGGVAGALGRTLRVDARDATVVGVMPAGFAFPDNADVWRPLSELEGPAGSLTIVGRLAPGATPAQARDAVAAILQDAQAGGAGEAGQLVVAALDERYDNPVTNPAWLAFITAALLVTIIAGSTVATLLLARGVRRQREIAVRLALGATRARIVRQVLVETSLLAGAGGIGALAVGVLGLRILALAIPDGVLPYWVSLTLSPRVVVTLALTCLGLVALSGLAPAWTLARAGAGAPLHGHDWRGATAGRSSRRWTWVFLTSQLGLTVLLLSAVGLTTLTVLARSRESIDGERILTFAVSLPPPAYSDATVRRDYYDRLASALEASGRVRSIALAAALPFGPGETRRVVTGEVPADSDPPVRVMRVDPRFFDTIGLDMVRGRAARQADGVPEAVVNARFASLLFGGDALDRPIRLTTSATTAPAAATVVGVVADPPGPVPAPPAVFLPLTDDEMTEVWVLAATTEPAAAVAPTAREVARDLDPDVPLTRLMTFAQAQWSTPARATARVSQGLITTIALVALMLATVGLTALTSQWVSQSARELGVRVALGAGPGQIVWLVLRRVLVQLGVGLTAGAIGAWGWGRVFGPQGGLTAPANLAAVAALVVVVTLGAAYWPARRASRMDPLTVIRGT